MSNLKFGTSGLRGLVTELPDAVCNAYTLAFLKHLQNAHDFDANGILLVGYDLRPSSPTIAAACIAAAQSFGAHVEDCGPLPTPALALAALKRKAPAIMVTGSHIPADRNGLKFYRPDGEIDKADEAGIRQFLGIDVDTSDFSVGTNEIGRTAREDYVKRCVRLLQPNRLLGKRIGVYQHSSVARDLIVRILQELGADVVPLGRSEIFVPVDTEALRDEDVEFAKESRKFKLDALVSTDGDADRPLVADEKGNFLRGDSIGLLTALFLNADAVVTPVTSSTAVELSGSFAKVYRTKVGSPYVIEGMGQAIRESFSRVVGFEANGGVLLGSSLTVDGGPLQALPTRDSLLPILAVLGLAAKEDISVSKLVERLPARVTRSGRIEDVDATKSSPFLFSLNNSLQREDFFSTLGAVREHDDIDGVRTLLSTGEIVHFRASGNAPELRCYAEASDAERAEFLLQWGLNRARDALELNK